MNTPELKIYKRNRKLARTLLREILEEKLGILQEQKFNKASWSDLGNDYVLLKRINKNSVYMKRAYESKYLLVVDGYTKNKDEYNVWSFEIHKSDDLEPAYVWMFNVDNILKDEL